MKSPAMLIAITTVMAALPLAAQAQGPDGKALYEKNCRSCHGAQGTPPAALAKQMKIPKWDAAFMAQKTNDSLVHTIRRGGKNMKGFEGKLSPEEMAAVAKYVRELVGPKPTKE